MPKWIYSLPNWQTLLLFTGVALGICWGLIRLLRPLMERWFKDDHESRNGIIDILVAGTGLFYGLLLGLIAVGAYTNYSNADDAVSREANAAGVLYRDVSNFPEPQRSELRADISHYIEVVINQEFPSAHHGKLLAFATPVATKIQNEIASFAPTSFAGAALDNETFHQFANFIDDRNQRLNKMTSSLPRTLWFVLIVGAVINLALIAMLGVKKLAAHLVLSGIFAIFLSLMLFLTASLDHPFLGEFSISPDAFGTIHDIVIPQIR
ncbi:MAG: DUF4239 domain-containing protein [Pseudonocardiales bacterium]|nr:DUF4239 domain-containing protein [Pseudonocardiales bacterium]